MAQEVKPEELPVQEVRIVTTPEALTFYAELLERAIRTAELQLEDWRKELNFVLEELKRSGIEWRKS